MHWVKMSPTSTSSVRKTSTAQWPPLHSPLNEERASCFVSIGKTGLQAAKHAGDAPTLATHFKEEREAGGFPMAGSDAPRKDGAK